MDIDLLIHFQLWDNQIDTRGKNETRAHTNVSLGQQKDPAVPEPCRRHLRRSR